METEYLDEEQVISLYNKVRTGKKTWPTGIWSSPAALQYAVTVFDYWIHNVMGWKGWPDARGKVTPALLEEHRLADLVESVFVPEFGDDWLDFEVVLNESMRLSEDEGWAPDVADRQERVEAAFEHAFEKLVGSPKQQPKLLPTYHRFRNHLLRMWSAFQEAQAEHDKAERESAERFWAQLRRVRSSRGQAAEAWSIVNADDERRGEVVVVWGEPHPYCVVVLDDDIEVGGWEQVIYRLEQEILVEEPGVVSYAVWHKGFVGEYYRCADCGELHSQFDEDSSNGLRLDDLEPPQQRRLHAKATARRDARDLMLVRPDESRLECHPFGVTASGRHDDVRKTRQGDRHEQLQIFGVRPAKRASGTVGAAELQAAAGNVGAIPQLLGQGKSL